MIRLAVLAALLTVAASAARADFSIVCDEKSQLDDILRTIQDKGFAVAKDKFHAYMDLIDDRQEPTCEATAAPLPAKIGDVVSRFPTIEFLPEELHDVVVVEIKGGEHPAFATLNRYVAPKAAEAGL